MKKDWQIRGSLIYLIVLIIVFIGFILPVGIEWLAPFIGIWYYLKLKKAGKIKPFDLLEIILMATYTIAMILGLIYIELLILTQIPWYKIILVGMAADLYGSTIGSAPIFGDITSAIIGFILPLTIIGGLQGIMLGFVLALINIIPGPSLGANTLFLIIFKLISYVII